MSSTKKNAPKIDLHDSKYYFNRALSWLEFNQRVLHEAYDPRTPLLERLKFMAIFSSNLDEFFMVRVAGLRQQVESNIDQRPADGLSPQMQLDKVRENLQPMVTEQHRFFAEELRPQLAAQGVHLLNCNDLNSKQKSYLQRYFEEQIFPVLTPLAVDPAHPFPYISSLSLNLAVLIQDISTGEEHFARVKVPNVLPRFIRLPEELSIQEKNLTFNWSGVPLEEVIAQNLDFLFPGMSIQAYHPFRITRSADLELENDKADDLLIAIEQEIRKRRFGSVVRMEIQASAPDTIRRMLIRELSLQESDVYDVGGLLCLNDLMSLRDLPLPQLKDQDWSPVVPQRLAKLKQTVSYATDGKENDFEDDMDEEGDLFFAIRQSDLLLHHPYHSFSATVQRFITQAAHDPDVLAIKMTLYRTSGDSPIVKELIAAAENGKQVAVLVELKARFDEQNNILWARQLEKVGVHVVYGLAGLKTHTKTAMVVRREEGRIRRYVHIGTGNYNPRTANLYEDLGLLSCCEELGADLTDLFNYLTGYSRQRAYRKLLVAPLTLRDRMLSLIQRETEQQIQGNQGHIIAKMNALTDVETIVALYKASQAGVKIDLIIRGMCCLRPGVKDVSENIRVISVIGRFLEHSRIFYFHNQGNADIFIGSADWRARNLDRRVEAAVPVEDPKIAKQLRDILDIMLNDNRQAWELQPDGHYVQLQPAEGEPERGSQQVLMNLTLTSVNEPFHY